VIPQHGCFDAAVIPAMFPGDSLTIPVDPCECEWTKTFETEQGTLQGLYRVCVGGCGAVTDWPDVSAQACAAKDCFMKHLQLSLMILIILYFTADARLVEGARTYHFFLLAVVRAVTSIKVYFRCKCSD
jgi:hypothetical protein